MFYDMMVNYYISNNIRIFGIIVMFFKFELFI